MSAIANRWSARSFAARAVSSNDLIKLFEAARWSTSARNEQPWRFLMGVRGSETYKKIFSTLSGHDQAWAQAAPVLILGVAHGTFSHNQSPNAYALYDLGTASGALTLQAAALGMTTHTMAGFDHAAARQKFQIPDDTLLGAVIALGYQGEPAASGKSKLISLETAPRTRKPLSELVLSDWEFARQADRDQAAGVGFVAAFSQPAATAFRPSNPGR